MENHNVYVDEMLLCRPDAVFKAAIGCCFCFYRAGYETLLPCLNAKEQSYYDTLKFEKRRKSYLLGRFAAKSAVAALTGADGLANVFIASGVFAQPIVVSDRFTMQISITHCDDFGAALAFPEAHPMGIDIERIAVRNSRALEGQITKSEADQINSLPVPYGIGLTLLWTVKEALSKTLKTGLMTPFEVFEVSNIVCHDNFMLCYFKNFAQYKAISFLLGDYICSIVHPLKTTLDFDITSFQAKFISLQALL